MKFIYLFANVAFFAAQIITAPVPAPAFWVEVGKHLGDFGSAIKGVIVRNPSKVVGGTAALVGTGAAIGVMTTGKSADQLAPEIAQGNEDYKKVPGSADNETDIEV